MNNLKERICENGIDYVLCGDYYIPEIQIPRQDRPIGHYGRLRKAYLREFRPVLYQGYISQGKLFEHLVDVNTQAQERMDVMMEQIIREWGVDEALKAKNEMGWVQLMNQAWHCAEENVLHEVVYV